MPPPVRDCRRSTRNFWSKRIKTQCTEFTLLERGNHARTYLILRLLNLSAVFFKFLIGRRPVASIEVSIGCARGSLTNTLTVRWVKNGRQASFMSRERTWENVRKKQQRRKKMLGVNHMIMILFTNTFHVVNAKGSQEQWSALRSPLFNGHYYYVCIDRLYCSGVHLIR